MKITNKKEYLQAVCTRRVLKLDIIEYDKNAELLGKPRQCYVAEALVTCLTIMINVYHVGLEANLTIEITKQTNL